MKRRTFLSALLFASAVTAPAAPAVRVVKDVAYRTDAAGYEAERSKLDLYLPEGPAGFPVVVWFHGGGLTAGDKDGKLAVLAGRRLASEGIAVAAANYRLSPKAHFPAYVEDAAAATAWVLRNIERHGGNPRRLVVAGHSAGAYLTLMIAADGRYLGAHGLSPAAIAGAIPVSGQTDAHTTVRGERGIGEPRVDDTAPLHYVRAGLPPFLLLTGSQDMAGRSELSRRFETALRAAGDTASRFVEVQGRTHDSLISLMEDPGDEVARLMVEFIRRVTGNR